MIQTIHEAAQAIRAKRVTPVDLVEQCLANIDRWEPKVRAWVFVDRDGALAEAKRLTDELGRGQYRGPLHGIPLGVKDIFDVFDWPTAAGSKLWANSVARADAQVVKQLRQAGAIFLGKTVTTQFASFDPPVTRNPWDLSRTPGGSSSGSAAAVATLMCLGALGSQTGGSITRPASYCGVAGCKPSYGRLPLDGIVPLAPSMDHPGPIARCVDDLLLLFRAMNRDTPWHTSSQSPMPIADVKLLWTQGMFTEMADAEVLKKTLEATIPLCEQGADLSSIDLPAGFSEVIPRHRTAMAVEAARFHEDRLRRHPDDYQPRIRELLEEGLRCPAPEYVRCKEHQAELTRLMTQRYLTGGRLLLTPATTSAAPAASTTGNPAFNSPWSYTGLPTVSIPIGRSADGLPLSIQLVGGPGSEEHSLFWMASWVERALGVGPLTPPLPA